MKRMDYQYKSSIAGFDFEVLNGEIEAFCAGDEFLSSRLFSLQLIIEELFTGTCWIKAMAGSSWSRCTAR